MAKVKINQGRIVPWQFRFLFTIMILGGMMFCMFNLPEVYAIIISIALSFLLPPVWTSYRIMEIDTDQKTISNLTWAMGERSRSSQTYSTLEKIFINAGIKSQKMNSYGGRVHEQKVKTYSAYLKTSEGSKHFLVSDEDESNLIERLSTIQEKLNCPIDKNYQ
ncbi:MAG: hypothetical protein JXR10_14860 [Cyclobacteriaceae bacterium]